MWKDKLITFYTAYAIKLYFIHRTVLYILYIEWKTR